MRDKPRPSDQLRFWPFKIAKQGTKYGVLAGFISPETVPKVIMPPLVLISSKAR